jgi:hypothetical protein
VDIFEPLQRIWEDLVARPSGPLALRFLLQPAVSSALAIRDGFKDAREGRSAYFWSVVSNPAERRSRLNEGLKATGKVMILAVVLDAVYQIIELGTFYPGESIIVAFVLGFLPYLILRGPVARIKRRLGKGPVDDASSDFRLPRIEAPLRDWFKEGFAQRSR